MPNIQNWLKPPLYDNADDQLRSRVLHWISLVAFVTVVPLTALLPFIESTYQYSMYLYVLAITGTGTCFVLVHRDRVELAAIVMAVLGWVVTLWSSFASGGVASPQLSMGVLAIMLAGILLSGRGAIVMALTIAVSLLAIEFLRDVGLLPRPFIEGSRFTVWAALTCVLVLSAVLLQLYINAMRDARDDAALTAQKLADEMQRRVATEASLQRAEKLEALGRLSGGVAHDFNNILMVLLGESELLEEMADERKSLSQEGREHLRQIRQATERAVALTSQLLAFSRQQPGQPEEVSPDVAVRDLATMLDRLIREDVSLHIERDADGAIVRIDPGQLDQVLMNLALNGSDAMPGGGTLCIHTSVAEVGTEAAELNPEAQAGTYLCIEVIDSGTGIAPEDLEFIFDPFFTTKSIGQGTGLGLASTHGIVTEAGGYITVDSVPGEGATVRVFLPVVAQKLALRTRQEITAASQHRPAHLLLCEDDDEVRRVTQHSLDLAGHDVVAVEDAEQALAWLSEHADHVDVLISDVILPGMNGVQLAKAAVALRPGLRVLLISGYTADVLQDTDLSEDTAILHKPFRRDALLDQIERLVA